MQRIHGSYWHTSIDMHAFMEARNQLLSLCGSFGLWMINCIPDLNVTRVNLHQLPRVSLSLSVGAMKVRMQHHWGRIPFVTDNQPSIKACGPGLHHRLALGWVWPLHQVWWSQAFLVGTPFKRLFPRCASTHPSPRDIMEESHTWYSRLGRTSSASSPGETCPRSWHAEGAELVQKCLCFLQFWLVESFFFFSSYVLFYCPVCSVLDWWVSRIMFAECR